MMLYQLLIVISILYNHLVICFWYNMLYQYNFCVILIWNWYKYFRKMLYWSGIDTDFWYKCYIDIKFISIFNRNVILHFSSEYEKSKKCQMRDDCCETQKVSNIWKNIQWWHMW